MRRGIYMWHLWTFAGIETGLIVSILASLAPQVKDRGSHLICLLSPLFRAEKQALCYLICSRLTHVSFSILQTRSRRCLQSDENN